MKNRTILKMFIIPLIIVMFVQALIAGASVVFGKSLTMLSDYSVDILNQTVKTREVILENNMIQSWSNVSETVDRMNSLVNESISQNNVAIHDFLKDEHMQNDLLNNMLESCLYTLRKNAVTGSFIILGNPDGAQEEYQLNGIYFRDVDPYTNSTTYSDVLMERGSTSFSKELSIPLDIHWKPKFHVMSSGVRPEDDFFYRPLHAARHHPDIDYKNLGYWSLAFCLEGNTDTDSYQMITYSVPLILDDGTVYGVMGVEISVRHLIGILPAKDFNNDAYGGYILARSNEEGNWIPVVYTGMIADRVVNSMSQIVLKETAYDTMYEIWDNQNKNKVYYSYEQLHLYNTNTPFESEVWILGGVQRHDKIFGMGNNILYTFAVGLFVAFGISAIAIYILARRLTGPIIQLAECIRGDQSEICLSNFQKANIVEIDELYDVVSNLTREQEENENRINEEKERYKIVLQGNTDVLFAYDFHSNTIELQNISTTEGKLDGVQVENWDEWIAKRGMIHPDYRAKVKEIFKSAKDIVKEEVKARARAETPYLWVALHGKVIYDVAGNPGKLIGSIQNIHEKKEKELKDVERQRIDPVTGLYKAQFGEQIIKERLRQWAAGCLVLIDIDSFYKLNETYGMIFGDAILEEIGNLINEFKKELQEKIKSKMVTVRAGGDEILLWMGQIKALEMKEELLRLQSRISNLYAGSQVKLTISGGISEVKEENRDYAGQILCLKQALAYAKKGISDKFVIFSELTKTQKQGLQYTDINEIASVPYKDQLSIVSLVFNFFDKGGEISGILPVLLMKLGRHLGAAAIAVISIDRDFRTAYTNYLWQEEKRVAIEEKVAHFSLFEFEGVIDRFGSEVGISLDISELTNLERRFLFINEDASGISVPMFDNGNYTGSMVFIRKEGEKLWSDRDRKDIQDIVKIIESNYNKEKHDMASQAKSDFLSRMSHEIRTPMNAIIGMTAIAMTQKGESDKIEESLVKINQSSKYLLSLINDILDMSKIESGKMKLSYQNFNLPQIIDNIINLVKPQADEKNLHLETEITITREWLIGDMLHLNQVLINLLSNAVKFTPDSGTVTFTVKETIQSDSETEIYFSVKDTGIGVSEENQERIFHSFEQEDNPMAKSQTGTGLGLAISSHLVNMMGGAIELESELSIGSKFYFSIVLKNGQNEPEDKVGQDYQKEKELAGKRVLLVDDNSLNIEIAQTLLELNGLVVETALDGREAVEKYQQEEAFYYDMILMDIRMPVMNGLEATKLIRKLDKQDSAVIPIVAMTANAFDEDMKKSIESGMNGHLSKPVDIKELLKTMSQIIL